jgi:hypothetical protein
MVPSESDDAVPFNATTSVPLPSLSVTIWSAPAFATGAAFGFGFTVTTTVSVLEPSALSVTCSVSVCVPTFSQIDGDATVATTAAPSRHS